MQTIAPREARPFCWTCRRAQSVCICGFISTVETTTRLVFLQDEVESWNPLGTAQLAHLSLPGSELLVGRDFAESARLRELLDASGKDAALLWPSGASVPLERLPEGERPRLLVVVDGTWPRAREIVAHTPALRALRRVSLLPGERSRYRIRMQPRKECISTIEAVVRALDAIEGAGERLEPLLDAFDRMVDRQIARAAAAGRTIVRDLRAERARRPLPAELAGDQGRLVFVHGETLGRRGEGPQGARRIDLVQWQAFRQGTRERFSAHVKQDRPFTEDEGRYLGIPPRDVEEGLAPRALGPAFDAFAREGDVYVSWGYFASNAFARLRGRALSPQVDLRAAAKRIVNRRVRLPEDALYLLDRPSPPSLGPGRCGARLAALASIVEGLRDGRTSTENPCFP